MRPMTKRFNYLKRKTTLLKKANQLNKLCDVSVCMVCFGPDKTVETWPENKSEVCDIISKYKLGYNMGREKKLNLVGFLENKKKKLEEKSNKKMKKKNLGGGCSVYSTWDERLDRFSEEELVGLCGRLDSKLQNLTEKINLKKKNEKPLVVNPPPDHHNLNWCNNVYWSNNPSSPPPLPLWFSGDCSSYNQQPFSGSQRSSAPKDPNVRHGGVGVGVGVGGGGGGGSGGGGGVGIMDYATIGMGSGGGPIGPPNYNVGPQPNFYDPMMNVYNYRSSNFDSGGGSSSQATLPGFDPFAQFK